eukprot:GILJ01001890.1.p1 GENE.GILJ01001890.1~~GILJ01001890.1.p1  ORF type:complete len:384 (+),score=46.20 GILJ01001890.1:50-1153(+)
MERLVTRMQGPTLSASSPAIKTGQLIASHEAKDNPEPQHPSDVTYAYGDRQFPKLVTQLSTEDRVLRYKVVSCIAELFEKEENIQGAIKAGLTKPLSLLLKDDDSAVRERVSKAFVNMCKIGMGRADMVAREVMLRYPQLWLDPDVAVRLHAFTALKLFTHTIDGIKTLVRLDLVGKVVGQAVHESTSSVLAVILDVIHNALRERSALLSCLAAGAVVKMNSLLTSEDPEIRHKAAKNLYLLSLSVEGKAEAIQNGVVAELLGLLKDTDAEVRASASGALASLTIAIEAKRQVVESEMLSLVTSLLNDSYDQVVLNIVQLIGNVAENSTGRQTLGSLVPQISNLTQSSHQNIQKAANNTLTILKWKP